MTKIVIVQDDNKVSIDGDIERVTYTGNPNIHVIHWDTVTQTGEIQYKNKGNETITDFTPYQHFITNHNISKTVREQKEIDDTTADFAALTPQEKRNTEYPSVEDQLSALHFNRGGNSVPLAAIDAAMDIIDAKYPL